MGRMIVFNHLHLPRDPAPEGLHSQCVAGPVQGLHRFRAWVLRLGANASTPWLPPAEEQALIALMGCGRLVLPGGALDFRAPCSLRVPAGEEYQLLNTGMSLLSVVRIAAPGAMAPSGDVDPGADS